MDDRIEIVYDEATSAIDAVMQLSSGYISQETLADSLELGDPTDGYVNEAVEIRGESLRIGVRLAS